MHYGCKSWGRGVGLRKRMQQIDLGQGSIDCTVPGIYTQIKETGGENN